jgi:hypothetical protein
MKKPQAGVGSLGRTSRSVADWYSLSSARAARHHEETFFACRVDVTSERLARWNRPHICGVALPLIQTLAPERFKLLSSPCRAPRDRMGHELFCAIRGEVTDFAKRVLACRSMTP